MKTHSLFGNMTIKKANILTIIVIFIFSLIFVSLLVNEMYKDYELALHQSVMMQVDGKVNTELIKENKQKLKTLLIKTVLAIVTLSFIIFAIALGFYKILNMILQSDIEKFLEFFEKAAHEEKLIDPKEIFFQDFKYMVTYANEMVRTIAEQKHSLRELNLHLEDRVKEKTRSLEIINENLGKEKQFSEEILKAQKEFLRYTVHETNTPLSVILTNIELHTMKHGRDKHLSKIEAAVKNIFSIYDDLSYLVKKDQLEYPKSVINLEKYIQSRIEFFSEVAEQSLLHFDYTTKVLDAHIYFNETKLQRVVDNTLTNAIKYTLPKETIFVTLKRVGSNVEFAVGSKSKAIENQEKIFEPFYREGNVIKERDGFGLGLKLVQKICEEEDIDILLDSNEERTTFAYRFKMMGE
ncbi:MULTISPECIES: HAMP domain-containing sensor histidine kinase [Sulfurimonas]|uniref:sensor histidine kinase n=1 Tax=Sulfurimonas TaxID=202746 RepID=UPI0012643F79|nr:HAMP domain-containing sensor histidine kinase [Sulfurimonas indica]